ncbi:MAG: hypothetical protein ABH829_01880 [archaeon]
MKIDSSAKLGIAIIAVSGAIILYTMVPAQMPTSGMFSGQIQVICGDGMCTVGETSNSCPDCDIGHDFYGYISTQGGCEPIGGEYSICLTAVFKGEASITDAARLSLAGGGQLKTVTLFEGNTKEMQGFDVTLVDALPAQATNRIGYALIFVDRSAE